MQTSDNGKVWLPNRGFVSTGDDDKATNDQLTTNRIARSTKRRAALKGSRNFGKHANKARWSDQEEATLLTFAGEKTVRELSKLLGRTEIAVYRRLARLSLSSQLKDGYTPRLLAEDLRVSRLKVRQWLLDGKLESRNLQVSRRSIKKLCERREAEITWNGEVIAVLGRPPDRVLETMRRCERKPGQERRAFGRTRRISQSYTFRRAARILQVSEDVVRRLITAGLLKLTRLRIEEEALKRFIARYPNEVNWHLVDPEVLEWLGLCRIDDGNPPSRIPKFLKHLIKMRTCPGCHHSFRGNGYGTHVKFCPDARYLEPEVLQWAADHPRPEALNRSARMDR